MNMRESLKTMTDEEFETQRGAVNTKLSEKDKNLYEVTNRMYGVISTHTYRFNKQ